VSDIEHEQSDQRAAGMMRMSTASPSREAEERKRQEFLTNAEAQLIEELSDRQLMNLVSNMDQAVRCEFFERHPNIRDRVHLFGLKKMIAVVKASSEE